VIDVIGGQVPPIFSDLSSSLEHIKAGKLRPLAVTSATRLDALPGIPALAEFLPGYEASTRTGLCAPRKYAQASLGDALAAGARCVTWALHSMRIVSRPVAAFANVLKVVIWHAD
jgi:tripartite-type tricarboxylate transporter receptor subunit TctC